MQEDQLISIAFGAMLIIFGILTATQHPIGLGNLSARFTLESIRKFLPFAGFCEIFAGIGSIIEGFMEGMNAKLFGWLMGLVAVVAFIALWKNILVKKH